MRMNDFIKRSGKKDKAHNLLGLWAIKCFSQDVAKVQNIKWQLALDKAHL
jgi:hypothetical protein